MCVFDRNIVGIGSDKRGFLRLHCLFTLNFIVSSLFLRCEITVLPNKVGDTLCDIAP